MFKLNFLGKSSPDEVAPPELKITNALNKSVVTFRPRLLLTKGKYHFKESFAYLFSQAKKNYRATLPSASSVIPEKILKPSCNPHFMT